MRIRRQTPEDVRAILRCERRSPNDADVQLQSDTATAGDYLQHLPDALKARPDVGCIVLFCRVSDKSQKTHMPAQVEFCKTPFDRHGNIPLKVFQVIGPANGDVARQVLAAAVAYAKRHGGFVVAESTTRFVRSGEFNSRMNPDALPSKSEFVELMRVASGVSLATIHHPDLPPHVESARQKKRGMMPADKRGGRPKTTVAGYKKSERLKFKPEALKLRRAFWSIGKIAKEFGKPKSTVQTWLE